ncbi:hypothetical protein JW911_02760 [Candidatus Peregrinibacteria bacterium]|nr:hypothetical protein [Candidatus Peregrinibacteria bacterium]
MKKLFIGLLIIMALMLFMPVSVDNIHVHEETPASMKDEIQVSLLSAGAGSALLPFILVLGPGGVGFVAYVKRQRKKIK